MTTLPSFISKGWVLLLGSILLLVQAAPAPAAGTRIRRTDPHGDAFVDVWSTSKVTVIRTRHRIWFRVHGSMASDRDVSVYLDSRGGDDPDYRLWHWESLGEGGCGAKRIGGEPIERRCGLRVIQCCVIGTLWWSVPRREVRPDKKIRWYIRTGYPGDYPGDAPVPAGDRAPDVGRYP